MTGTRSPLVLSVTGGKMSARTGVQQRINADFFIGTWSYLVLNIREEINGDWDMCSS